MRNARTRAILNLMLVSAGLLIGGCMRAGQVVEDRFVAPERFEFRAPAEDWRLVRNRRTDRLTEVRFRLRRGGATLGVRVWPLSQTDAEIPLDVLGHQLFFRDALARNSIPELESMIRIALDEREAVAFTGAWVERPKRWGVSSIVLRSQGFLMVLSYSAPPAEFERHAGEFEMLLRHFRITLPGHFDPYLLEDLPMGAPGPSPGDANRRPLKEPPAPGKPRTGVPGF